MRSSIEYVNIESGLVTPLLSSTTRMPAPTWFPDGETLLSTVHGRMHQFSKMDRRLKLVDTHFISSIQCDYGLSPDGSKLAVTNRYDVRDARIFLRDMHTGEIRIAVHSSPSWFHGWSRDGSRIIYTCIRDGDWAIAQSCVIGDGDEEEILLRSDAAMGTRIDGPEFSPDGRHIWYNSDHSGTMQIWRKDVSTGANEQMTDDGDANFFPHPSPDGKHVCFLKKRSSDATWCRDGEVELWLLSLDGADPKHLLTLTGGLGTLNGPTWSPTGQGFAYARYSR